jgi:hypothetical protein
MDYLPGTDQPLPPPPPLPLTPEERATLRKRLLHYRGSGIGNAIGVSDDRLCGFGGDQGLSDVQLHFLACRVGIRASRKMV